MKQFKLLTLVLASLMIIGFAGNAAAGGVEPPGTPEGCLQIMQCGEPDGLKKKGPYLRGTFTLSNYYNEIYDENYYVIHLFLRWRGNYYLTSITADEIAGISLCDLTDADLIAAINGSGAVCKESPYIWQAFDVTGVPVVKKLRITKKGHCPGGDKRIIKGYIAISMAPEEAFIGCPDPE